MIKYLLGKASTGKFRWWTIECDEHYYEGQGYCIQRSYGQLHGKETFGPEIYVAHGKAKRTTKEQLVLQFNSELKKQLDKGYKEVDKHPNEYTEDELNEIFGSVKMRKGSTVKPMLAKQADKVSSKTFDKEYYGSRKVNGVRCLIYNDNGQIRTASRGATDYDLAIFHIINHPKLIEFFKNHPDSILDGEIYKMGLPLNKISGICRTQATVADGKDLEFYWYDIVDLEQPFSERYKTMQEWSNELELSEFDPYKHFSDDELHIQFLPQVKISGYENMKKLHDEYVEEGWEGLVVRLSSSVYKPGSRGNDWIKIKEYLDDTYKVIGYELGLRGSEDMVFICEMKDGRTFKASPMGDRVIKEEYVLNFDEKYKNQLGDCKYFEMSPYGIPQQPKFISFRWDLN